MPRNGGFVDGIKAKADDPAAVPDQLSAKSRDKLPTTTRLAKRKGEEPDA